MSDPFAGGEKHPAVSFKGAPVGTVVRGRVVEAPKAVQSRNFESGEPDFWPDGNPKMSVVTILDIAGEKKGLWAPQPSALFAAIKAAIEAAGGTPIEEGGELAVKYVGEKPNEKNPRLNPQKLYEARYTPPAAKDPFDEAPAPAPAAQAPAPAAAPAPVYAAQNEPW